MSQVIKKLFLTPNDSSRGRFGAMNLEFVLSKGFIGGQKVAFWSPMTPLEVSGITLDTVRSRSNGTRHLSESQQSHTKLLEPRPARRLLSEFTEVCPTGFQARVPRVRLASPPSAEAGLTFLASSQSFSTHSVQCSGRFL